MKIIRSFFFNCVFIGIQALFVFAMVFTLPFHRRAIQSIVRAWAKILRIAMRSMVDIRFEIRGMENIPQEPCIFASKHQSAWDTFAFYLLLDDPSYVVKKELMNIPIWNWCARKAQVIPVDREGNISALRQLVIDVKDRLNKGSSVIIFPEGTRTKPGAKALYHPGIAALYMKINVPIIPVALNSGLFWSRHSMLKHPGTMVFEILPALPSGMKRKEFMTMLENRIETTTTNLIAEVRTH